MATGVTGEWLAKHVGVDPARVRQLVKVGAVVKISHDNYDGTKSLIGLVKYYRDLYQRKESEQEDPLNKARTRLTETKADIAAIDLDLSRGKVLDVELVGMLWTESRAHMRSKMLSVPTRLTPQLLGQSDTTVIHQLLKDAVYEALDEVAEFQSQPIVDAYNEKRHREDLGRLVNDDQIAAEADGQPMG